MFAPSGLSSAGRPNFCSTREEAFTVTRRSKADLQRTPSLRGVSPRNTIKAFVNLLAVLEQNPSANWKELLGSVEIARDDAAPAGDNPEESGSDDLANLRL